MTTSKTTIDQLSESLRQTEQIDVTKDIGVHLSLPSACLCKFQRCETDTWNDGIAITTCHGLSDVIAIYPRQPMQKPREPVVINGPEKEIWDYRLDWSHSLDLDRF